MFDETHDEKRSRRAGRALILDTNGNGKRDAYVEPNQPVDPTKDKRIDAGLYAVAPAPDGSIWGTVLGFPGAIVRLDARLEPARDGARRVYEPPDAGAGGSRRAASTSIATASSGRRWRAATWRASIGASARVR